MKMFNGKKVNMDKSFDNRRKKILVSVLMSLFVLVIFGSLQSFAATVTQTGAEKNSVTVSWTAPSTSYTVLDYNVYVYKYGGSSSTKTKVASLPASQTSYTIGNLAAGTKYSVEVKYDYQSRYSSGESYVDSETVRTLPGQVTGLRQKQWWYFILNLDVEWDRQDASDGYEYICYKNNGKVQAQGTLNGYSSGVTVRNIKNEMIYTFKVRSFENINGQKVYGDWSPTITCFTQPRITSARVNGGKLTVKWNKVSGATGYAIYVSTKKASGYKKVKTVSGKKGTVTLKKFKGKKFNPKKRYFVYVVTLKKVNGRMNTSGALYYWNSKDTRYGYL